MEQQGKPCISWESPVTKFLTERQELKMGKPLRGQIKHEMYT